MAESFNSRVQDAIILAHIRSLRQGATLSAAIRVRLAILEQDILALLTTIDPAAPVRLRTRQARLDQAIKEVQPLLREAYSFLSRDTARQITTQVLSGIEALAETINAMAGVPLLTPAVSAETISILVTTTTFPSVPRPTLPSTTAPEWWKRQMAKLGQRVEDALNAGIRAEETLSQLTTRLRGTARQGFTDGVMAMAKKDAESLALTQMSMGHNQGRVALWDANAGVVKGIQHLSTLDSRTSTICIARSGLQYTVPAHEPIGHSVPYLSGVPYHFRCRSVFNPIFPTFEELLGAKGRRFDQQLNALPEGTQASIDGKLPASTTFNQWLQRQPAHVQVQLLGKTRRALWQDGKMSLEQLLSQTTGRVLRIEEL